MPDQNTGKGDPKKYPILAQMNTADLKRLLAQELDSLDDAEPDIAFMEAITEVIKEREAGTHDEMPVDIAGAWQELQGRIANESGDKICIIPAQKPKGSKVVKSSGFLRTLRSAAVIALIFLAACGTASAFGINVFQAVAQWTTETFHFAAGNNSSSVQTDPYAELRSAVAEITDVAVVPNWAPEGTSMEQDVRIKTKLDGTLLRAQFHTERGTFSFRIQVYNETPPSYNSLYQKDNSEVSILDAGGVSHYILHNNGKCGAIWTNGLVEVALQGDLIESELEEMIRSIYEENGEHEK